MSPTPQIHPLFAILSLAIVPIASADVSIDANAVKTSSSETEEILGIRIDFENTSATPTGPLKHQNGSSTLNVAKSLASSESVAPGPNGATDLRRFKLVAAIFTLGESSTDSSINGSKLHGHFVSRTPIWPGRSRIGGWPTVSFSNPCSCASACCFFINHCERKDDRLNLENLIEHHRHDQYPVRRKARISRIQL